MDCSFAYQKTVKEFNLPGKCPGSTRLHGYHNLVLRDQEDLFFRAKNKKKRPLKEQLTANFLPALKEITPNYRNKISNGTTIA